MKSINRASRRQLLRMAERVINCMAVNKELFPVPPVDVETARLHIAELNDALRGQLTASNIILRQNKFEQVQEDLRKLKEYLKREKMTNDQ